MDEQAINPPGELDVPQDAMICPSCKTTNEAANHFCIKCKAPLSAYASIDPLGQIDEAGHTYQKAVVKPTKFIMVLGM